MEELRGNGFKTTTTVTTNASIPVDDNALKDLMLKVKFLQNDLDNLKNEFSKWIKSL